MSFSPSILKSSYWSVRLFVCLFVRTPVTSSFLNIFQNQGYLWTPWAIAVLEKIFEPNEIRNKKALAVQKNFQTKINVIPNVCLFVRPPKCTNAIYSLVSNQNGLASISMDSS